MTITLSDDLAVLDVETTGLGFEHDVWEVGVAIGEGRVDVFQVEHSLRNADFKALELNGYRVRSQPHLARDVNDLVLRKMLEGKTIIGANPGFDVTRLQLRWGVAPWHYRTIDVESMAVPIFGLTKPLGLKGLIDKLASLGYYITENDHTVAGDVAATREVYKALMSLGGERHG